MKLVSGVVLSTNCACILLIISLLFVSPKHIQVQGKYYYRIDPLGEGAKWRRSFGQEIYSPLLLAFAEEVAFFFLYFCFSTFILVMEICF